METDKVMESVTIVISFYPMIQERKFYGLQSEAFPGRKTSSARNRLTAKERMVE